MSSTNRGSVRQEFDYYVTDPEEIVRFLREWVADEPEALQALKGRILDPCAGGSTVPTVWEYKKGKTVTVPAGILMSYPAAIAPFVGPPAQMVTNDIRADSPAEHHEDFLTTDRLFLDKSDPLSGYDLVITNPPFSRAVEIVRRALQHTKLGGFVVMLQRLNFYGSSKRREFFRGNMPGRTYVHPDRLQLIPTLRDTDSIEYAHYVWRRTLSPPKRSLLGVL